MPPPLTAHRNARTAHNSLRDRIDSGAAIPSTSSVPASKTHAHPTSPMRASQHLIIVIYIIIIVITKFVDREKDLGFLKRRYEEASAQVIVLYGRRRVGKSRLIQEFIRNKRSVYHLASRTVPHLQISDFMASAARELDDDRIPDMKMDWEVIFKHLTESEDRTVIAIDEFPYLIDIKLVVIRDYESERKWRFGFGGAIYK